jgi:hypothetical protein
MRRCSVFLAVLALAAPAARAVDTWSFPHPGVALLERTTATPWRIFALRVDLCARGVSVRATAQSEKRRTPSSFLGLVGAQAVVNGDFFDGAYDPIGLAAGDGSAWHGDNGTLGFVAFGPDRSLLSPPTDVVAAEPWMREAVGGFPVLVENGAALSTFSPAPDHCPNRHPRTAVGFSRDRRTLWMVVVDGRSTLSAGMTCRELALLMEELGCWEALNLDGGGSSALVVAGRGAVNRPSDGSERVVANHLAVLASGAGAPGSCDLWMEEAIVDAGVLDDAGVTDVDGDGRADLCARGAAGFRCYPSTGDGFAAPWVLDDLSDENGWSDESRFATIRTGDIDGDGRSDVCARGDARVHCWPSTGAGFGPRIDGPELSDAAGWNRPESFTTLRLADVDGDDRDDLCGRAAEGFRCWPSVGSGFGPPIAGPEWSDAGGWNHPDHYGTIRTGDIDGDGRSDVCARGQAGMICALSRGDRFDAAFAGPAWSDAAGFARVESWSTIRLVDLDGDGRSDLCARTPEGVACHLSAVAAFGPAIAGPTLTDASGWADMDNASTLRFADVDGDGDLDACARANAGMWCWPFEGAGFGARIDGPAWNDAAGWDDFRLYATIRMGDLDGDGRADLCGRSADGVRCHRSTGAGFGPEIAGPALADSVGWHGRPYFSTIRFAGPRPVRCVPDEEICNGIDDDCDGETDEGCSAETAPDGGDAGDGSDSADAIGLDAPGYPDGARDGGGDGEMPVEGEGGGGCGCSAPGAVPGAFAWLPACLAAARLRRRRR